MAEYSSALVQTVQPGQSVTFTTIDSACNRGFVRFRQGTGAFLLSGWVPRTRRSCCCCNQGNQYADYLIDFGANIAIPATGAAGQISLTFVLNGSQIPASTMQVTPTATDAFFNVSRAINVPVWTGCCESFTIQNTSTQAILVQNANLIITRPDLAITR